MIAVTGMHRSGTSCVTGLLEKCGLSLGTSHPLLTDPRADNQKGHFENRSVIAINETIITKAGGTWYQPPSANAITSTGARYARHFAEFGRTFNGDVIKDPRICLTISLWEKYCPDLTALIVCLRNPIAVAGSLKLRDGLPVEAGVRLWYEYNVRLFSSERRVPIYVVDYDSLNRNLEFELSSLCADLGLPLDMSDLHARIARFYSGELNHAAAKEEHLDLLPADIRLLYEAMRSHTYARRGAVVAAQSAVG